MKELVDDKAAVIRGWIAAGRLAPVDPYHLIFSIWALTQHYSDFEVQVRLILADDSQDPFAGAEIFLETLYRKLLSRS